MKKPIVLFFLALTVPSLRGETSAPERTSPAEAAPVDAPDEIWSAPAPEPAPQEIGQDSAVGIEYFKKKLLRAKETVSRKGGGPAPAAAEVTGGAPVVDLTLQEALDDVVFYNPSVEAARLEWLSGTHISRSAWGDFEPDLVAEFKRNGINRENSILERLQQNNSATFKEERNDYKAGIEGKIPTGASYNVGYSLTRQDNNLTTNNEYQSFAGAAMTQPLFKGAWFGVPMAELKLGKVERRIAFHNFRVRLTRILYEAETAYWGLAYAQEAHRMAVDSVEVARKLVRDARERVKTGKMSSLDLVEAEAGLADRMAAEADSRQALAEAMNRLKLLLSSDRIEKESWIRAASPLYEPEGGDGRPPIDEERLEAVFHVQPDVQVKRQELAKEKVLVAARKDQTLPELNANGSYGYSSLGVTRREAWEKLKDRDHRSWSAGLQLRMPLLLGLEERNLASSEKLKKRSAEEALKAVEYDVASSLRVLESRVSALRERIGSARNVVDFRKRLLDVELVRLDAGKSNTRLIYEAEEKLAESKRFELDSLARHREAAVQLSVISGDLLSDKGFETVKPDGGPVLSESLLLPRR